MVRWRGKNVNEQEDSHEYLVNVTIRKDVECYVCGQVLTAGSVVLRCDQCKRAYFHAEGC